MRLECHILWFSDKNILLKNKKSNQNLFGLGLSANESEGAMCFLEDNPDKIDWVQLSANKSEGAIRLIESNQDKINWELFGFWRPIQTRFIDGIYQRMNRKELYAFWKPIKTRFIGPSYLQIHLFFSMIGLTCV